MGFKRYFLHFGFTLAEVLITLSIIGIVAALTIPGVVKHHNEKAWATAQDLFTKKLDVAMKQMNTDGTLRGYATTEDFVNALKKNITINEVCKDDVTKCFAKTIQWRQYGAPVTISNGNTITLKTGDAYDWAEPIGVRFANGVNAILAYNKNCSEDPFNNQYSPMANCIGIIYDVSGNTKPNKNGADIATNGNIEKLAGQSGCVYQLQNETCFSKILAPRTGFSPFPIEINGEKITCSQAIEQGLIESSYTSCAYGEGGGTSGDYWAGAQYACGGLKKYLPDKTILYNLAQELYTGTGAITQTGSSGSLQLNTEKAAPFLAQSPGGTEPDPWFNVWGRTEGSNAGAYTRHFYATSTPYNPDYPRNSDGRIAVCLGD